MSTTTTTAAPARPRKQRPPRPARVLGYLVAAGFQVALLVLINVSPGWDAVPFLTAETPDVLPAVNASIVATLVANVLWVLADPRWLRALGDTVTSCVSLVAAVAVWRVFPFDLEGAWEPVVRVLVGLGVVGTAIGIVAGLVTFVRELRRAS